MKKGFSEACEPDDAIHVIEKINFLNGITRRLHSLELKRKDLHDEIRGTFRVVFAFVGEPSTLTKNWIERIDEVVCSYEDSAVEPTARVELQPLNRPRICKNLNY